MRGSPITDADGSLDGMDNGSFAHVLSVADSGDPGASQPGAAAPGRRTTLIWRVLPIAGPALALVLGLVALGRRPLDAGEAAAVAAANGAFGDVVQRALEDDPARAGYLALLQPFTGQGASEAWARLPSALAAVAAAALMYRVGRTLAGRLAGLAAALMLAGSAGVAEVSRSARPLTLAIAAMLLSAALFIRAVEDGRVGWWVGYAVTAALLPLTHPIAAAALVAEMAALMAAHDRVRLRNAVPVAGFVMVETTLFLTAAILDRAAAEDGAGRLELTDVAAGIARSCGWSPVVAALAIWGVVVLASGRVRGSAPWQAVLVAGLVAGPPVAVLVAGIALPVYPAEALVAGAAGISLAAGIGLAAIPGRRLRLVAAGAALVGAVVALGVVGTGAQEEDWRSAAAHVRADSGAQETVVVLPAWAGSALTHYAPSVGVTRVGRGEGVWVVVLGDPESATATARSVVSPPRYALQSQQPFGTRLVVQHWVRP